MNIYFIRHGDPDYTTDSLTNLGHRQAELLSQRIKNWKIDEVYQSSMGRAQQTAVHSLSKWKKEAATFDWLKELCWGDFSGDAYSSASPWIVNEDYIKNRHYYPDGEQWKTLEEFKNDRIVGDVEDRVKALDEFLKAHGYVRKGQLYEAVDPNDRNIAFFCHGGVSCALIAHLLNMSFWHMISHVGLGVTSISKISFSKEKGFCAAQLEYLNSTEHLD